MIIRNMVPDDLIQLKDIHDKFYKNDFNFPNFNKFLGSFVVVENEQIITGGGIVAVPEAVILTDKDALPMKKVRALLEFLSRATSISQNLGAEQIHAFVQDDKWQQHLLSLGFEKVKGTPLVLNL